MNHPNAASRGQVHRETAEDARVVLHWPLAPDAVRLHPGEVHLWAAATNEFVDQEPKLAVLLSSAEQVKAQKFRFVEDRNQYVIRRGVLRLILSRYLGQRASAIEFQHGPNGKPELRRNGTDTPLFFNTSHSDGIAICAITSACPIGVDVEHLRKITELEEIASRYFLPNETRTLMDLPVDSRMQSFYACWTRKEAVLKATGKGIAESLAKVEVTLAPEDQPAVVSVSGDLGAHEQWQLQPFCPAPNYVACVAYRNTALALRQWRTGKLKM